MSAIPGWKMVPEVATDKMIDAGEASFRELTYPTPADAYRAMLAAAPTPPEVAADDRARFESWAKEWWFHDSNEECHASDALDIAWQAWQAALAAKGAE